MFALLLSKSVGAKMKKGIRNFCNGDGSTSTLSQYQTDSAGTAAIASSDLVNPPSVVTSDSTQSPPTTLEEMIKKLEVKEELSRKAKLNEYGEIRGAGRMSCVSNSDIQRSARNALNHYPRFSLDGKDHITVNRSSFRNSEIGGRKSVYCDHHGLRERHSRLGKSLCLASSSSLGGESVIWCKPGVVAKLMGLESMPVPISSSNSSKVDGKQKLIDSLIKRQNLRRRAERHEMERRLAMEMRQYLR